MNREESKLGPMIFFGTLLVVLIFFWWFLFIPMVSSRDIKKEVSDVKGDGLGSIDYRECFIFYVLDLLIMKAYFGASMGLNLFRGRRGEKRR